MTGRIHSFQSLGTLDGPGVRFIVFLHGCNLHCGYCHNVDVCHGNFTEYTAEDVFKKVLNYREYFGKNGGITVSGGEPLLQADFVTELFSLCKQNGIHTVLDTSGSIWNASVEKLLEVCDLVLLDLKMSDDASYKSHIGCSIDAPLHFLDALEKRSIPCWIRNVIVGGLNDTAENISALKRLTENKTCIKKTELLPFRKLCAQKYEMMNRPFPFAVYDEPSQEKMDALNEQLNTI